MSNLNGINNGGNSVNRIQALKAFGATKPAGPIDQPATSSPARSSDRVELSGLDGIMAKLKTNDVRHDKVAAVRQQIAEGSYETPEKLDAAIEKMMEDLD